MTDATTANRLAYRFLIKNSRFSVVAADGVGTIATPFAVAHITKSREDYGTMSFFKHIAIGATVAVLLAGVAYPQSGSAAVPNASKARFERQRDRITHGVQNGSLTQHEYNRDVRRLDKLHAERRQMLKQNHGTLTKNDRQQLRNQLTRSSHQIYYTKHNTNRQQPPK